MKHGSFDYGCPTILWLKDLKASRDCVSNFGSQILVLAETSHKNDCHDFVFLGHLYLLFDETDNVFHDRFKDLGGHVFLCHGEPIPLKTQCGVHVDCERLAFGREPFLELRLIKLWSHNFSCEYATDRFKLSQSNDKSLICPVLATVSLLEKTAESLLSIEDPHLPPVPSVISLISSLSMRDTSYEIRSTVPPPASQTTNRFPIFKIEGLRAFNVYNAAASYILIRILLFDVASGGNTGSEMR